MRALTLVLVVLAVTFLVMGCAKKREELPQPEPGELATTAPTPAVVEKPAVVETPPMPPPVTPRIERPGTTKPIIEKPVIERPFVEKPAASSTYTVKKGDSLSTISKHFYGDQKFWKRIYDANKDKIKDANKLKVGTVLTIPPK
jgi:nucleoid-associated protein YgaU